METISKALYEAPLIRVLDLVTEGVICLSGTGTNGVPTYNGFNTEEEW